MISLKASPTHRCVSEQQKLRPNTTSMRTTRRRRPRGFDKTRCRRLFKCHSPIGFSSSPFKEHDGRDYNTSPQRGLDLANTVLKDGACRIHGVVADDHLLCQRPRRRPFLRVMTDAFAKTMSQSRIRE
jgi:hypothetical protein